MAETITRQQLIADLNDRFRRGEDGVAGRMMLTQGVVHLAAGHDVGKSDDQSSGVERVLAMVRAFDTFDRDNDPYGEHDFGAFTFEGETLYFKFDYYTPDMMAGAKDPTDPKDTLRVLTIMLASEY